MNFKPNDIDFITWDLRYAEWDRARRRAKINALFNGVPPYTDKEVQDNNIEVNVNDLSGPREAHNARAQFTQAFMKPGNYFVATTDTGTRHKRSGYGRTVTKHINKIMKRSLPYFEAHRSKWAMTVLHGISPCVFVDADLWCPRPVGIDDVLVPGNTELVMDNLPFFPVYRQLTGPQLIKLAKGPRPDPGWNQGMVDACLKWIDDQTLRIAGDYWPDWWQPEKWEERIKGDGAYYASDRVPTINVWDFYYWNDDKKVSGWNRRMILDAWTMPDAQGMRSRRAEEPFSGKDQFLYNPGNRKWADNFHQIVNWQFADLSAVAPFHYHTVRSLGWLLYSVCHLQNRLRCKFNEAVFEQLMVLMRVKTADDMQRALSVNLVNRGFIDESIDFIKAGDRYQVNAQLAQMGLMENNNLISRNSSSFTSKLPTSEKVPTATQWMGEEQKITQLVSAGLIQAYEYQKPEYNEIFRRFTKKNSKDPEVRQFQNNCLKDGVPSEVLYNLSSWDCEPERVLGAGNKTLEMMIAQQLMAYRHLYDPEAQRDILRDFTLAVTDDPGRTAGYVPEQPQVSNSVLDAQQSVATLLMGQPMALRQNVSHAEYAQALLEALSVEIQKINAIGGVPESASELIGLQNLAGMTIQGQPVPGNGASNHIELVAQDKESKQLVKVLGDQLGEAMNQIKAFAQRLQEQAEAQAQSNGGLDPETMANIQNDRIKTEAKAANTRESHAQRTAQRAIAFELEQDRKNQETIAEITRENARLRQELQAQAAKAVIEIEKMKATPTPAEPNPKQN